jgi:hypothetical protein
MKPENTDGANLELLAEDMSMRWQAECMYLPVIMRAVKQTENLDPDGNLQNRHRIYQLVG